MSDFNVLVSGFKSRAEADEFIKWFSGQGEQDLAYWFEEAASKNPDIRPALIVDIGKTFPIQSFGTTRILELETEE